MKRELSEREQEVYELRIVQNLTIEQCAEKIGVTKNAISKMVGKIKKKQEEVEYKTYWFFGRYNDKNCRVPVVTKEDYSVAIGKAAVKIASQLECPIEKTIVSLDCIIDCEGEKIKFERL